MFTRCSPCIDCLRYSFAGIGKRTVIKKFQEFKDTLLLGDLSASNNDIVTSCLKFVATLYGKDCQGSLDTMRRDMCTRKTLVENVMQHQS